MVKVLSQNSRPQFESVGTFPAFLWPPKLSVPHGGSNHLVFNKPTRLQNCRLRYESLETFPDVLVATKTGKFSREGQTRSPAVIIATKTDIFSQTKKFFQL